MKHEHTQFQAAIAYADDRLVEDRVRRFLPMVRKAAWHVHGSGQAGLDIDDLLQTGLLALTDCARRHTGPTEDGFAAYAKLRVRGAMIDAIRRAVPGSRGRAAHRRDGTDANPPVSFSSLDTTYDDAAMCFADERPDPFAMLCEAQDAARLATGIAGLAERLQLVLQLFFLEELNLAEIAAVLDVSVPRVHQLKAQAIAMLRDRLDTG